MNLSTDYMEENTKTKKYEIDPIYRGKKGVPISIRTKLSKYGEEVAAKRTHDKLGFDALNDSASFEGHTVIKLRFGAVLSFDCMRPGHWKGVKGIDKIIQNKKS